MENNTYRDVLNESVKQLREAVHEFLKAAEEVWQEIKDFFESHDFVETPKVKYHVPVKVSMQDQVLNRKPLMAVARSRC
ncbi:hypothetical protein CWR48_15670 [Oceanobacillus arenosus]|uniref:Uncharacterized protein n=1 Tax=Oceanobacillus arenosus TaxID=1229153 RepID=A0A3D8PP74_9BACI|nr:hypothetical protein [Oceanobacillus arenosus]RDW17038.1 hypothetical protein CWR48_15670 [Oceanobacillus arenosus]